MKAVIADNLSKNYSPDKKAVNRASFSLDEGEIFGFLGPNGAGKTTTVKLLGGMLAPSEGSCEVFGINPAANPAAMHQISGVVTEHAQMYDNLSGLQNLIFYGNLFGLQHDEAAKRALSLLEELDLADARDKKLAAYSTGMRQRLSLARAMIHSPKILFLDEPTSGLDPESAQSVNNLIRRLAKEKGTTVFLCTHQLRYAQELCTGYGLIDEGFLLASGDLDTLRSMIFSGMTVTLKTDSLPNHLKAEHLGQNRYEISVDSEDDIPAIINEIVANGGNIYHVSARKLSLEEIYFSLIERRKGGNL